MSTKLHTLRKSVELILRQLLDEQPVCILIYTEPCEKHDVYRVHVMPWAGMELMLDIGRAISLFSGDDVDEEETYIRSLQTVSAGTSLTYKFRGVKCHLTVWHVAGIGIQIAEDAYETYVYSDHKMYAKDIGLQGEEKKPAKKAPKSGAEQTAAVVKNCPEQLTTTLYLLVTLLGGKTTVRDMEALNRHQLSNAFKYLRIAYRKKFFNAKEKTGARPACLRECFTAKKG